MFIEKLWHYSRINTENIKILLKYHNNWKEIATNQINLSPELFHILFIAKTDKISQNSYIEKKHNNKKQHVGIEF